MNEKKLLTPLAQYAVCPSCKVSVQWDNWQRFIGQKNIDTMLRSMNFTANDGLVLRNEKDKNPTLQILSFVVCNHCNQQHVFYGDKLIYPSITNHIDPHELLNNYQKAKKLFEESLAVAGDSPRAGLTLSRMCLESVVNDILVEKNEATSQKFNENITKLFELDIISKRIKELLDDARVIGNKTTHNFNLIDSADVTLEDCMTVWKVINRIFENIQHVENLDNDLSALKEKVKE